MSASAEKVSSQCTVALLLSATVYSYVTKSNSDMDQYYKAYLDKIHAAGYEEHSRVASSKFKGQGKTSLGAVCLKPLEDNAPLIISFGGTLTSEDMVSDLRLSTRGVVEKALRDEAYQFYEAVRRAYPNREIILTGHSLGGHFAQYVATKAYSKSESPSEALVQVRTFNTAPIDTKYANVFKTHPKLLARFVNYRLDSDLVSNLTLPMKQYYGSTYVFPCPLSTHEAHGTPALEQYLQGISSLTITNEPRHILLEQATCMHYSYQCRVNGQYFSQARIGARNLKWMNAGFPTIIEAIKKEDYHSAHYMLTNLKHRLSGHHSKNMIDILMHNTNALYILQKQKAMKQSLQTTVPDRGAETPGIKSILS